MWSSRGKNSQVTLQREVRLYWPVERQCPLGAAVSQEPHGSWEQVDTGCHLQAPRGQQNTDLYLLGRVGRGGSQLVGNPTDLTPAHMPGTPQRCHSSSGPSEALGGSEDTCFPRITHAAPSHHPMRSAKSVRGLLPCPRGGLPPLQLPGPPGSQGRWIHSALQGQPSPSRNSLCPGRVDAFASSPVRRGWS